MFAIELILLKSNKILQLCQIGENISWLVYNTTRTYTPVVVKIIMRKMVANLKTMTNLRVGVKKKQLKDEPFELEISKAL